MLVTIENKQVQLLEAMRALGDGWHDRQEIAAHLGKNKLNPSETTVLETLVASGKLDKELQPGQQAHVSRWVYRVKGGKHKKR